MGFFDSKYTWNCVVIINGERHNARVTDWDMTSKPINEKESLLRYNITKFNKGKIESISNL